jgi:hypothetical protein
VPEEEAHATLSQVIDALPAESFALQEVGDRIAKTVEKIQEHK